MFRLFFCFVGSAVQLVAPWVTCLRVAVGFVDSEGGQGASVVKEFKEYKEFKEALWLF